MDDRIVVGTNGAVAAAPSVVETHISTIFFAGDRGFKLARRVSFPFLDTQDRAHRLELAERELELNRRFTPDVYLGLADVVEHGELTDRMIVMRRLPDDRRLSNLVDDPSFDDCLRRVARNVAAIHAAADPIRNAPMAMHDRLAANWADNFTALAPHVGSILDADDFERVQRLADDYLTHRADLFSHRIADGFVRDGHGDLVADDIFCFDDGPRILDCLAFDDDLRVGDVLNDIAFLVMDVHRLAGQHAAMSLMRWYQEFTNEQHPSSLAHHYVAYRAHVRAKVACLRASSPDARDARLAQSYHQLALHHLERARLRSILVGGGPGVGKTELAKRLADHFGYVYLATDEIRHDLTAVPHGQHAFAAYGTGQYAPEVVTATYDEQRREAELLMKAGHGVVLDASWTSEFQRAAVRKLARSCGAELVEIECHLDESIARERIERRLADPLNESDATPDLVDRLAARRDPWPTACGVSTLPAIDDVVSAAIAIIERANPNFV
jgi:uncharacterized protein